MNSEQNIESTIEAREGGWLDLTGAAVSWVCVVHCLVMPFFISLAPLIGISFLVDESIEQSIIGISVLIAAISLLPAFFRQHGKIRAIVLFVFGISLIVVSHAAFEESAMRIPVLLAGAVLISAAHLINRHLCRICAVCQTKKQRF
jgi:hypothetical protein